MGCDTGDDRNDVCNDKGEAAGGGHGSPGTGVFEARYLDRGRTILLEPGSVLPCGLNGREVCCLLEGEAGYELLVPSDQAYPVLRETCRPGDILGIVDAYSPGVLALGRAEALLPCRVYAWTRSEFDLAVGIYQELARRVIQLLSRRLRKVNETVRGLGAPSGDDAPSGEEAVSA